MRVPRWLVVLGAIALASGVAADDVGDIKKSAERVLAAYSSGDAAKAAAFFAEGADLFGGNGRMLVDFSEDELAEAFAAGTKYDLAWRDLTARVHGETGITSGYIEGSVTLPDGTVIPANWRNSATWVKDGGKWKLAQFHTSDLKPDVNGAQAVVSRYHQAIEDKDAATARACLGDSYVRAIYGGLGLDGDPSRWHGDVADAAQLDEMMSDFAEEATYENSVRFLHTSVDELSGIVVTSETGSFSGPEGSGAWEDVANLWWVTKADDGWKIAGSLHNIMLDTD